MGPLVLPAVILGAVCAVGLARVWAWRRDAAERALPGRSEASAIDVGDFGEIDLHAERQRCDPCEVKLSVTGEGSREVGGRKLRIVRLACRRCQAERELYFALPPGL